VTEIRNGKKVLITPITEEDVRALHIGDTIYIDGHVVTGRDAVHDRVVVEGLDMPVDIHGGVDVHAGPIVRDLGDGHFEMVAIGPTTSMRMEHFEYDFIKKTGVRILVGKGGMQDNTAAGCKEFGAVHCVFPAGNAIVAAVCIEEIESAHWLDLGMPEAVYDCRVKEFGPLIVGIDADGRNFFEEKKVEYEKIKDEEVAKISAEVGYIM
jgi:L(+)-tartrate dehydratase beta subunit